MTSTIWSREDQLFPAHLSRGQHSSHKHLQMYYYAGLKVGVFFCVITDLYCCHSYMDESNDVRKFVYLNFAHSCHYSKQGLVHGGLPPKLAHSSSYSPASVELGEGCIAFDRTHALSTVI